MNVSYVTIQFPVPSETFATNEVKALTREGVSIRVYGLRAARSDTVRLARERGVEQIEATHNGVIPSLRGAFAALRRPRSLLRSLTWITRSNRRSFRDLVLSLALVPRAFDVLDDIERHRPDVVHLYWGHYPSLVGYLVQQRLPDTVTSISIVAYDLNREYGGTVDVARNADVVRTHARANVAHIARFVGIEPQRIEVIYNGTDVAWIEEVSEGIEKAPFRLVTTGRLIAEKGMDDVLTAFARIRAAWPEATLVVAGDGPDRERLRAIASELRVADGVEFIGHVSHARVIEEMAKAEVFLLLSRYASERLPNVVKEAMACRCVCVTTPTIGIEELVANGVTGFIVPMSAPQSVFETVDALFAGRVDVGAVAGAATAHIAKEFDLRRTAPRYERLWRAALTARTPAAAHVRHAAPVANHPGSGS